MANSNWSVQTEQSIRTDTALIYRPEVGMYVLEAIVHAPDMQYEPAETVVGRWPAGETIGDELAVQLHIHRKRSGPILGQLTEKPLLFEVEISATQLSGRSGLIVFVIEEGKTRAQRELQVCDPSNVPADRCFETIDGHQQLIITWDENLPLPQLTQQMQ